MTEERDPTATYVDGVKEPFGKIDYPNMLSDGRTLVTDGAIEKIQQTSTKMPQTPRDPAPAESKAKVQMSPDDARLKLADMAETQRQKLLDEFDYDAVPEGMRNTARYLMHRGFMLIAGVSDGTVPDEAPDETENEYAVGVPVVGVFVPPEMMSHYAKHLRSLLFQEHGILVNPTEAEPYPQIIVTFQAHADRALLELVGVNDEQLKPFEDAPEDKPVILSASGARAN